MTPPSSRDLLDIFAAAKLGSSASHWRAHSPYSCRTSLPGLASTRFPRPRCRRNGRNCRGPTSKRRHSLSLPRGSASTNLLVLGRPMIPPTQRFAQARALWHFLFGRVSDPFLITPAHTDRQRVERAFAAELLAPAAGIRDQLDLTEIEFAFDDIEPIAEHFEVSSMVIQHQIENQILASS